jgi:hypothetical protein
MQARRSNYQEWPGSSDPTDLLKEVKCQGGVYLYLLTGVRRRSEKPTRAKAKAFSAFETNPNGVCCRKIPRKSTYGRVTKLNCKVP